MSATPPPIGIGLDLDLEPIFTKIAELDTKLEAFAQKSSRIIVNALGTDPEFARQFETSIKSADSTLSKFLGRVSSLSGSLNGALDKVGEAVVANVQSGLESVVGGISNDLKQAGTEMGTAATNAIRTGSQVVSNELKVATEKTAAEFQQNIANLIQQAEGAASKVSDTVSGKGGVKANAPVTNAARSDIDDILGGQAQLDGLAKRINALNQLADQFKQNFGEDFAGAEVLVRRALDALNADLGSFEKNLVALRGEELNQKNSADALSTQLTKLRSDLATTNAQLQDITKGKITDDNKGVAQALANRVNLLQNEIKILDPVQKAAAQGAQALAQKFDLVKQAAEQAGLTVKKTADGVLAFTKAATTSDQFSPKNLQKDIDAHRQTLERAETASLKFDQALSKNAVTITRMGKTVSETNGHFDKAKQKFDELTAAQNPFSRESLHSHEAMLAILGVSRLLPGGLGQAVSGFALLDGATRTTTGALLSVGGILISVIAQLAQAGSQFNVTTNEIRAQAEGLGLSVTEVRAFKSVLEQTNGSIENFAVGIKKINEAQTGIGPESAGVKNLLELALAGTGFQLEGAKTKDVIIALAKNIDVLEKSGLAGAISAQIFGRSWDEVKGRLRDLADQELDFEKAIEKSGISSEKAQQTAKDYGKEVAKLQLAWEQAASTFAAPVTAVLNIVTNLVGDSVGGLLIRTLIEQGTGAIFFEGLHKFKQEFNNTFDSGKATPKEDPNTAEEGTFRNGKRVFSESSGIDVNAGPTQAQIDAALKANDREKKLASIESEIADREIKLQKKGNEISQINKDIENDQNVVIAKNKAGINDAQLTAAEEKQNIALAKRKNLFIERDRLQREISDLKKQLEPHGRTQGQKDEFSDFKIGVENLKTELQSLDPASTEFFNKAAEIESAISNRISSLQKGAKDGTDPGARNELSGRVRELRVQLGSVRTEIETARRQIFQSEFDVEKNIGKLSVEVLSDQIKQSLEAAKANFQAGTIDLNEFIALQNAANEGIIAQEEANAKRQSAIIASRRLQVESAAQDHIITPKQAREDNLNLDTKQAVIDNDLQKSRNKNSEINRQNQLAAIQEIIAARQKLFDISIQIEQAEGNRRLELIKQLSADSLQVKRLEIEESAKLEKKVTEDQITQTVRLLRDKQDTLKKLADAGGLVGGDKGIQSLFQDQQLGGISDQQLSRLIEVLKQPDQFQSPEILVQLEKILVLRQKLADIDQRKIVDTNVVDNELEKQKLDLLNRELQIRQELLSLHEDRVSQLEQAGIITTLEADERRLEIERERLRLIQAQIQQKNADLNAEIGRQVSGTQLVGALGGKEASAKALADIPNSQGVQNIRQELVRLGATASETELKIKLMDSTLGRLARGFDDIAQKTANLPAPFNGLSQVFTDVAKVIRLIEGIKIKTPAQNIEDATTKFHDKVIDAANKFLDRVSHPERPDAPGSSGGSSPEKKLDAAGSKITTGLEAVGNLLQGFTASTAGGKVAGFGGAVGNILSLAGVAGGPVVGAIAGAAGSVMDFISGIWRKKAEATAQAMQQAFQTIMRKFQDGSITLGEASKQTEDQVQKARQQLGSGKIGKKGARRV